MNSLIINIALTFMYASPIIITAIGGLFSERSGVTNVGLEGIMLVGAFVAAAMCYYLGLNVPSGSFMASTVIPWVCVIAAAIAGMLFSLLHAVASIKYKADQIISGTAINMLATGLTVFLAQIMFNQQRTNSFAQGFGTIDLGPINNIPIIGQLLSRTYQPFVLTVIIVILTAFIMKKTKFGLRLRACGEFPQAASSMGINVYKMRYTGVLLSGLLAGLGGGIMVLTVDTQFTAMSIHGTGFIALATLIFGKWNSWGVFGAGLFFGLSNVIAISSNGIEALNSFPQEIFYMVPYVFTIIALIVTSGKSNGPKAAGEIYDEGKR
ncbi:ABC transporter permease [Mycoplasma sp. P36-A1]|uniref:ABC transporter permease n=1 Tax=Mycoplasma sp. P36-A1 TaxID=3252900 RepID=UPI003C2EACA8